MADEPHTQSAFEHVQWSDWTQYSSALNDPRKPFCEEIWGGFSGLIEELKDDQQRLFAQLIQAVSSFHFDPNMDHTYGPKFAFPNGSRSLVPGDLPVQALEVLSQSLESCPHLDLKARIADVIWIAALHLPSFKKRRFEVAKMAVVLLVEVADASLKLYPDELYTWGYGKFRLKRAIQIALKIGQDDITRIADDWMKKSLEERSKTETEIVSNDILTIRLEQGFSTPSDVSTEALGVADRLGQQADFQMAESYYAVALRAAARTGNIEFLKEGHLRCGENLKKLAGAHLAAHPEDWAPVAHNLGRALNHLKQAGASKEHLDDVQRDICAQQERGMRSCASFGTTVDLSDQAKAFDELFTDTDHSFALHAFLFLILDPKGYEFHRQEIVRRVEDHPLLTLMPVSRMSRDGRVESVADGALTGNDEAVTKRLFFEVAQGQQMLGMSLRVARRVFLDFHPMDYAACEQMAIDSPWVPRDRNWSVARGIYRGWNNEWIECLHILMPQLENIIRNILQEGGIVLTKPNPQQQDYIDLGGMLAQYETELAGIVGEAIVLALRAACTERIGLNRRNDLAHGLIPDGDLGKHSDVYLWWLIQRLIMTPVFGSVRKDQEPKDSDDAIGM